MQWLRHRLLPDVPKIMKLLPLFTCLLLLQVSSALAIREAPKPVKPLRYKGVVYQAPHFFSLEVKGKHEGPPQNGGFVEAFDAKTGQLLWSVKVYEVEYREGIESDVFDVFITEMHLVPKLGLLLVRDERNRTFALSLKSRKVTQIVE